MLHCVPSYIITDALPVGLSLCRPQTSSEAGAESTAYTDPDQPSIKYVAYTQLTGIVRLVLDNTVPDA